MLGSLKFFEAERLRRKKPLFGLLEIDGLLRKDLLRVKRALLLMLFEPARLHREKALFFGTV
jgi:hypothetical protein